MDDKIFALYKVGCELLLSGQFSEAVQKFDEVLLHDSTILPKLWQRGIGCYLCGKYKEGREQFEADLQINGSDIEECLWHFLCNAGEKGVHEAQKQLIPALPGDNRVPLKEIWNLFGGKLTPNEFSDSIKNLSKLSSIFYAYYYMGLYYEAHQEKKLAAEFIAKAISINYRDDFISKIAIAQFNKFYTSSFVQIPRKNFPNSKNYSFSAIIKGCWQLAKGHQLEGPPQTISNIVEDTCAFLEQGITTMDFGDIYTEVEEMLGHFNWQYQYRRQYDRTKHSQQQNQLPFQFHTKFVPDEAILNNITQEFVDNTILRSLNRLGVESLDLVQFHWWDYKQGDYVAVARYLHETQKKGLIQHLGVTNFDREHLEPIVAAGVPIVSVQCQYSLLDRRVESELLPYCKQHNIQLLCYGVLAGGFLSESWLNKPEPSSTTLKNRSLVKYFLVIQDFGGWAIFQELLFVLKTISLDHSVSLTSVAARWVIERDQVAAVILGAHSTKHLCEFKEIFSFCLRSIDYQKIDLVLQKSKNLEGSVYELERDRTGKHGSVMKYNLSQLGMVQHFEELCRRFVELKYRFNPEEGSRVGLRKFDEFSSAFTYEPWVIQKNIGTIKRFLKELEFIEYSLLNLDQKIDYELIKSGLKVMLIQWQDIRQYERDPTEYIAKTFEGILFLAEPYSPSLKRIPESVNNKCLLSRLYGLQRCLELIEINVKNSPQLFIKTAIKTVAGLVPFFTQLADTYNDLYIKKLLDSTCQLIAHQSTVLSRELIKLEGFLKDILLPKSTGNIGIGPEIYDALLLQDHMLDLNWEKLLENGKNYYAETLRLLEECAKSISPHKSWKEITKEIKLKHPKSEDLLKSYMEEIQRAQDHFSVMFTKLAPSERVVGINTPECLRPFSPFGDFINPPPFGGDDDKTGILMLHPIEQGLSEEEQEKILQSHDFTWISVIAPHEAYPGHHLQALKAQQNPRIIRKSVLSPIFYEGWGLYCEELAYETGFYKDKETRLTQLRLRLWRAARVLLDIQLHTGKMSYDDCCKFLVDNIMFDDKSAQGEVNIYAHKPTYVISYITGYHMLNTIKQQLQQSQNNFDITKFHDTLLENGSIPFKLLKLLVFGEISHPK